MLLDALDRVLVSDGMPTISHLYQVPVLAWRVLAGARAVLKVDV